ncbi:DUF1016 N-terminal domain-containing protein [Pedobacter sp. WC2423]|uniref:DUF1016 N-terminal domain-containing protein n=1 Tax=Pedobacter sp. WC2423 TaxID=3234142 RepID=UPI003465BCF7
MKQVNTRLVTLYWEIGKNIIEKQKEHGWGKSVVEQLAEDLQIEFAGMECMSSRNIWRIHMFYSTYEKLSPLVAEIGWSQTSPHQTTILPSIIFF